MIPLKTICIRFVMNNLHKAQNSNPMKIKWTKDLDLIVDQINYFF